MEALKKKNLNMPDETKTFEKFKNDFVQFNGVIIGRSTRQPGWKWSIDMKPIAKTGSCQVRHVFYHLSGTIHVKMDTGEEIEFGPGDAGIIPPGHDAWIVGDKPAVSIDFMS